MGKPDPESSALKEQLADALAQVDSLQSAVADAEARAETGRERLAPPQREPEAAGAGARAEPGRERLAALEGELEAARGENERLGARLRESAVKYRDARLAAAPEIPADLVTGKEMEEIEGQVA